MQAKNVGYTLIDTVAKPLRQIGILLLTILLLTIVWFIPRHIDKTLNIASAEEKVDSSDINLDIAQEITLAENSAIVKVRVLVSNSSKSDLIKSITLPNIWNARKVNQKKDIEGAKAVVNINTKELSLNYAGTPIYPGQKSSTEIILELTLLTGMFGEKFFSSGALNSKIFQGGEVKVTENDIVFSNEFGELEYINLQEDIYRLESGQVSSRLKIDSTEIPRILLTWQGESSPTSKVELQRPAGSGLILVGNANSTQRLKVQNIETVQNMYIDDMHNMFVQFNSNDDVTSVIVAGQENQVPEDFLAEDKFRSVELDFSWRDELLNMLTNEGNRQDTENAMKMQNSLEISAQIDLIVEYLASEGIIIGKYDPQDIQVDYSLTKSTDYSYYEYIILILRILEDRGYSARALYLDRGNYGLESKLVINVCDFSVEQSNASVCRYFDINPSLQRSIYSRELPNLGFQLFSFSDVNPLLYDFFAEGRIVRPIKFSADLEPLDSTSAEIQGDGVVITFSLPSKIKVFSEFPSRVRVENNSNSVVFPNKLILEGYEFSIADNSLGGLHKGVLPGEVTEFLISDTFISHFFLGYETNVKVPVIVEYENTFGKGSYQQDFLVRIEQNNLIVGLVLTSLLGLIFTIVVLFRIHRENRNELSSLWIRFRRKIANWRWHITHK